MQFNGDTGSNYDSQYSVSVGTAGAAVGLGAQNGCVVGGMGGTDSGAATPGFFVANIADYARTTWQKMIVAQGSYYSGGLVAFQSAGLWPNTAAITQVLLFLVSGSFKAGTIASLYGFND